MRDQPFFDVVQRHDRILKSMVGAGMHGLLRSERPFGPKRSFSYERPTVSTCPVVSSQFAAPAGHPYALSHDGTDLWLTDSDSSRSVYRLDPADGTVLDSWLYPTANRYPRGVALVAGTLWVLAVSGSGGVMPTVTAHDPDTGAITGLSFDVTANTVGLCWDGTGLWVMQTFGPPQFHRYGTDGVLQTTIPATELYLGIDFDGTNLIVVGHSTPDFLRTIDPATGDAVGDDCPLPSSTCVGVTVDSGTYWVTDTAGDVVYVMGS